MPKEIQGEPGAGPSPQETEKFPDARLTLIIGFALAVFGFFLLLYVFNRNPSKGLELLTTNVLSLAVLVVICIQAHIYSRQRKHMEEQSRAMREQLDAMNRQQTVIDRQFIVSGVQADVMLDQWSIMQEQANTLNRQADAFEAQVACDARSIGCYARASAKHAGQSD